MNIRIDIQMDDESSTMRYIATATLDGKRLHTIGKNGDGLDDELFRQMVKWLKDHGHLAPDHYWVRNHIAQTEISTPNSHKLAG